MNRALVGRIEKALAALEALAPADPRHAAQEKQLDAWMQASFEEYAAAVRKFTDARFAPPPAPKAPRRAKAGARAPRGRGAAAPLPPGAERGRAPRTPLDAARLGQPHVWKNYLDDLRVVPTLWARPKNLAELLAAVQDAGRTRLIKAIGSGHSSAEVARPRERLVQIDQLDQNLVLSDLKDPGQMPARVEALHAVEAGVTIRHLNERLAGAKSEPFPNGLALRNMGSYDGQTIVGALCTGTHGTGVKLGPLSASVESVMLVTLVDDPASASGVRAHVVQVEPSDGVTDPGRFAANPRKKGWELVQDDRTFDAVVVSMGCMGVVYALTLNVTGGYWLRETRVCRPWSAVKQTLQADVQGPRHYDLVLSPFKTQQPGGGLDNTCLVTVRDKIAPKNGAPPVRKLPGEFLRCIEQVFGTVAITEFLNLFPGSIPGVIDKLLHKLETPGFESINYNVLILGAGADVKATSNEIAVRLPDAVTAVDEILRLAEANKPEGLHHTAPIGVRFVAAARGHLSPQNWGDGQATCMIETPLLKGTHRFETILQRIERGLRPLPGRPHWGQRNGASLPTIKALYPRLDDWLAAYRRFNKFGTFDNDFTTRAGF
jgi:hypothetical protein